MDDDDKFLEAMGLTGLEGEAKQKALESILRSLNMRVGQRLADRLSDEQVAEFENFDEDTPLEEIASWLDRNVPNRLELIDQEARNMKAQAEADAHRAMKLMNPPDGTE